MADFSFKRKPRSKVKTIRIGRSDYKIIQCLKIVLDGRDCYGVCDNQSKSIYVMSIQDKTFAKEVLLHEICHAILEESGVHATGNISQDTEEVICEVMAKNLANITV
jgi:Zn-dependent peptidase ImmA (M78 family)